MELGGNEGEILSILGRGSNKSKGPETGSFLALKTKQTNKQKKLEEVRMTGAK